MKIAVTASNSDPDSLVCSRFGRAKLIMVYDTEDGTFLSIDNVQNFNASQGAGIQTGQNLINAGVDAVISGHCGPKAFRVLSTAGIQLATVSECSVKEAVDKYLAGSLKMMDSPDVEGHWV